MNDYELADLCEKLSLLLRDEDRRGMTFWGPAGDRRRIAKELHAALSEKLGLPTPEAEYERGHDAGYESGYNDGFEYGSEDS